jgi:hypothetical protein
MTEPPPGIPTPKDLRSDYVYVNRVLENLAYASNRRKNQDIPKEKLKRELVLFLVEGKSDKKFWNLFVQQPGTIVYYLRIYRQGTGYGCHAGREAVKMMLDRKNLEAFPSEPIAKKTRNNRVLGLIDRDFEEPAADNPPGCPNLYRPDRYRNLFATETNDLETFLACYGGLSLFLDRFADRDRDTAGQAIMDQAEILGDAFRAARELNVRFSHIDDCPPGEFCRILAAGHPEALVRTLMELDDRNRQRDAGTIEAFWALFHQFRKERTGRKARQVPHGAGNGTPPPVGDLDRCRGHTLMQVLFCHTSQDVRRDLIRQSAQTTEKPENLLFGRMLQEFRNENSLPQSALVSSLRTWEERTRVRFLKKFPAEGSLQGTLPSAAPPPSA